MVDAYKIIKKCRLCGGADLEQFLNFSKVPLGNNYQHSFSLAKSAETYPLGVQCCKNCFHIQLTHSIFPSILYATNYTYLSGVGESFVKHLELYSAWVVKRVGLRQGSLIVDIGSIDGSCLSFFKEKGFRVCGVDPASLPAKIANKKGVETINDFFSRNVLENIISVHGQPSLVTSHNVLAHVEDIQLTLHLIYELLERDGWFCMEVGYFGAVKNKNLFDTIYHEHLDYHHASPLIRYLTSIGFFIHQVEFNEIQGGSIRLLAQKAKESGQSQQVLDIVEAEKQKSTFKLETLLHWQSDIEKKMSVLGKIVKNAVSEGLSIVGYGAPTKATLLLKLSGLSANQLDYVVEDNELKVGRFLPGTALEIKHSSCLETARPDIIIVFAWNFYDDIIKKLQRNLSYEPEIICPLPELIRYKLNWKT